MISTKVNVHHGYKIVTQSAAPSLGATEKLAELYQQSLLGFELSQEIMKL